MPSQASINKRSPCLRLGNYSAPVPKQISFFNCLPISSSVLLFQNEVQLTRRRFYRSTHHLLPLASCSIHHLQPAWLQPQFRLGLHSRPVLNPHCWRMLSARNISRPVVGPLGDDLHPRFCRDLALTLRDSRPTFSLVRRENPLLQPSTSG